MKKTRALVAAAGAAVIAATLVAGPVGTASAGGPKHHHSDNGPARVLIVLFDQMLPKYADQFNMPNFRRLRDSGTNFKNAYLGYMASETVIAHNVIPSGLPKNMGYTDEAYRDHGERLRQGQRRDAHHRRPEPRRLRRRSRRTTARPTPSSPTTCTPRDPGTKFITVGEKSYAVESATGASGDIAVRLSSRQTDVTATTRPAAATSRSRACPATGLARARRQERARPTSGEPTRATRRCAGGSSSTPTRTTTTARRPPSRRGMYP